MPVDYVYKGKIWHFLQSCESGVVPEYQGKGIWSKLMRFAMNYIRNSTSYNAVIGFPNYRNSYPGFKKMGWETLTNMNNYIMVNNSTAFSKVLSLHKFFWIIGKFSIMQRVVVSIMGRQYKEYKFEEVNYVELLWDDNDEQILSVAHTEKLIEWKKHYKCLKIYNLKKDGVKVASCIFRISEFKGAPVLILEKITVSSEMSISQQKAMSLILNCIQKQYPKIAFVRVWTMPNSELGSILKKFLFIKVFHPNPFIINQQPQEIVGVDWNLSFFDLD